MIGSFNGRGPPAGAPSLSSHDFLLFMLCPDLSFCYCYAASICALLMYSLVSMLFQASPSTPADQVKQWMLVKSWLPSFSTKWCETLKTPDGNLASVQTLFWMRVPLNFKRGRSVDHSSRRGLVVQIRKFHVVCSYSSVSLTCIVSGHSCQRLFPEFHLGPVDTPPGGASSSFVDSPTRRVSDMAATFTSSGPPFLPRRPSDPPTKRAGRS